MPNTIRTAQSSSHAVLPRRTPTRQAQLRKLLTRKSGATITQIQETFGWQPHTARAAISALRKTGSAIERNDGVNGSVYRIVPEGKRA